MLRLSYIYAGPKFSNDGMIVLLPEAGLDLKLLRVMEF